MISSLLQEIVAVSNTKPASKKTNHTHCDLTVSKLLYRGGILRSKCDYHRDFKNFKKLFWNKFLINL